jgi:hypothetical protein
MEGTRFQGFRAAAHQPTSRAAGGERRKAPRIPWEVQFSSGRLEGTGLIQDLSLSGANVMAVGPQPAPGEPARLFFSTRWSGQPLVLVAQVTRRTDCGFAVRFCDADARLKSQLIAAGLGLLRLTDAVDEPQVLAQPEPFESGEPLIAAPALVEPVDACAGGADSMVVFPGYMDESELK